MQLLPDRKWNKIQTTEGMMIQIAESFSEGLMQLSLDWKGKEVQITEGVMIAAAGNKSNGERVVKPDRNVNGSG